ncbi:ABC transporter ATP-binding protein [uncultured Tistrella sp.]|uniref:ABC transporter ATP-binding protein n=1 Tax=Tistrella mobilis TaxID=171437 RepID=UPI000C08F516|nr:ABC transporter ATP-binding protein [uncultured Tistrella sp.]MAM76665.1 ABC transporter [Tistrella sp.]
MAVPVLEMLGVRRDFRSGGEVVRALEDIDLALAPGEMAALLGPSGSGKSTLLLTAGLLEPPDRGRVRIAGRDAAGSDCGMTAAERRRFRRDHIGFVFQKANLIPFLTAEENVRIALEVAGVTGRPARMRAAELLDWLDLRRRAAALPVHLSGGEQQRVAIARAIANQPVLLLADEPTAALDADRAARVMGLFRRIAEDRGAAVLVVTHDHRALDMFHRRLVMQDGRLGEAGRGDDVGSVAKAF